MASMTEQSEYGSLMFEQLMNMEEDDENYERVRGEVNRVFNEICGTPAAHPYEADMKMQYAIKMVSLTLGEDSPLVHLLVSINNDHLALAALACEPSSETRH